eukprot:253304-Prymnesium_polylepis.1
MPLCASPLAGQLRCTSRPRCTCRPSGSRVEFRMRTSPRWDGGEPSTRQEMLSLASLPSQLRLTVMTSSSPSATPASRSCRSMPSASGATDAFTSNLLGSPLAAASTRTATEAARSRCGAHRSASAVEFRTQRPATSIGVGSTANLGSRAVQRATRTALEAASACSRSGSQPTARTIAITSSPTASSCDRGTVHVVFAPTLTSVLAHSSAFAPAKQT